MEKRLIAPVIITVCYVLFCVLFAISFFLFADLDLWVHVLILVFLLISVGIGIFVLVERIKEIRSGEEDDLGKY
ncbi:MAG: hypothetical protein LBH88_00980 [Candidatus Methanoplasma sp.]|jgi:predicted RND superfamily exporter protein|nr:hypothetical protein [Candidatus Methanoplasma sp.]